jgi:tubulin--tyrosine ligase
VSLLVLTSSPFQSTAIFESFEPESDDEEEEDEDEDAPEKLSAGQDAEQIERMKKLALQDFPEDEDTQGSEQAESDDEEDGTGVQTSQLRHFVIQVRQSSICRLA